MLLLNVRNRLALVLLGLALRCACAGTTGAARHRDDSRIRTVRYSPNEVYQFIGHYGFQSAIEFETDEKIQTVSIGDFAAWMVNPASNRLFLKPVEQNALTNMTVITDKRSYLFELHAEETKDIRAKEMVFSYCFIYPQSDTSVLDFQQFEAFPDLEKDAAKFNFNYSIRGSNVIELRAHLR